MFEDDFRKRLYELRTQKNVSARDMSLSIGQNASYINRIENGISMPSMPVFLFICDYLGVSPSEFFDLNTPNPTKIQSITKELNKLDTESLDLILNLTHKLNNK